jgi:TATA-box binding protein (TBP) (component of TFIID and TFIIIB)
MQTLTSYRVSTITAVARVCRNADGSALDLPRAFEGIGAVAGRNGTIRICTCKYGALIHAAADGSLCCDSPACRHRVPKKPKRPAGGGAKLFGDQITLVCRLGDQPDVASIKLFSNGRIHLTGARTVENAESFAKGIAAALSGIAGQRPGTAWTDPMEEFQICMINSDCDLGFEVKRTSLVQCMARHFPQMPVAYDPCMYPGVQIKFMWNQTNQQQQQQQGLCRCQGGLKCTGKGRGDVQGACRKVTIAVFQTGRVILTGAHSMQQLDDAHAFLVSRLVQPFRQEVALRPLILHKPMPSM